ncbi:Fanconi anemia group B protein [Hemicordylus capensis]|uniref:Fanconi anemia group B protein n=1 Tax=Hemicordylus capensis TaxID=884348 RepID=UPI002303693D|nr:Fanconi anemia group B protein [Hemicordylus capensis]
MSADQQEKLLSYNGEVLILQLSKAKPSEGGNIKMNKLHVRRIGFNSGTKLFVEKSTGSFNMSGEGVEMIHCSCASDFRTEILLPCILMKKKKKKSIKYMLLLLHHSNKFELVLHFNLDYELKEPIKLLAGPTVLWSYAKKLFYITPQTCTVLCAPVQFSSIKWAGKIKGEGIVVLGVRAACLSEGDNGQCLPKSDAFIWGSEFLAYAVEKQKILTNANFLPHAYSSIVSCMHICRAEAVSGKFRTSVVAVTCKSQLIFFQDGLPKEVHQLSGQTPCALQIAAVEGSSQLVAVSFTSGDACAIWKHSLQVASCWRNVKSILVDDFAGIGTEQILVLLKTGSFSESLNAFHLTDFGKINHVSSISDENDTHSAEELQDNYFLTIKALETRLQAGFASVRELQQHLQLKMKVLVESCKALIDLVQDQEHSLPSAAKEGLVSLWDETEKPFDNDTPMPSKDQERLVEEVWYRMMDDNLVVGVKLVDSFLLLLSDVTLSLVMDQKCPPTKCQCNVVTLKTAVQAQSASHWQLDLLPKRIKLDFHNGKECHEGPSQIKAFTAVTCLSPLMAFHRVHCMVLLHAKKKSCKDKNPQKSKNMTLLCGDILLSLAEISAGKHSILLNDYKCIGSVKDLLVLCAVSHKQAFQIISPDCTLIPLKTWLLEQMACVPVEEYPDCMVCRKSGSLNGTLFKWNLKTPFEGMLTVFYRNQTILFQCLHSLFGSISPTCKIRPLRLGSKKVLAEQLALFLEKEMVTLRHSFSSALRQTENRWSLTCKESKETDCIPAVQQVREAFKKEQKQSMLGMNQTVGGDLYRGIILNVAEAQLNSDMISWQCSSL